MCSGLPRARSRTSRSRNRTSTTTPFTSWTRTGGQARQAAIDFAKEGNCFTIISRPADLAKVADTIYSCCLCFALDLEEQQRSGFRYQYSVYQGGYSRNLIFRLAGQMEQVFQALVDRTRARLDVKRLKTIFGFKGRPHRERKRKPPRLEVVVERPTYDLTIFKLHFGKLTLKAYTKGERVLGFEVIVPNTEELRCGRQLDRFPPIVARLQQILENFLNNLYCLEASFISDETLDQLPQPSPVGQTRVGGIDVNKPRTRAVLAAALALACCPEGFTVAEFAAQVGPIIGSTHLQYHSRRAAYDLKKLRGKNLITQVAGSGRYLVPSPALRTIAALVILREKLLGPILAGVGKPKVGRKPQNWSPIDEHYQALRQDKTCSPFSATSALLRRP